MSFRLMDECRPKKYNVLYCLEDDCFYALTPAYFDDRADDWSGGLGAVSVNLD